MKITPIQDDDISHWDHTLMDGLEDERGMLIIEVDNSTTSIKNLRLYEIVKENAHKFIDIYKDDYTIVLNPRIANKDSKHIERIVGDNEERICLFLTPINLSTYKLDT
jgi:dihydroxyacetone kinase-like predicted kinase